MAVLTDDHQHSDFTKTRPNIRNQTQSNLGSKISIIIKSYSIAPSAECQQPVRSGQLSLLSWAGCGNWV